MNIHPKNRDFLTGTLVLLLLTISSFASAEPLFEGSGTSAQTEQIPSAFWPPFVETTEKIVYREKEIKVDTRGVLLRVEEDQLLIDFGRNGVATVDPNATNFYEEVCELMSGASKKEFPNFSLHVANKLMTFGRGKKSGPIRFEEVVGTKLYILLYLDTYSPELAQPLMKFGKAYKDLKAGWPEVEVVLMPRDRKFYDFGATVGYAVPYIAPHMRIGYIKSLTHGVDTPPAFAAVDNNGRMLYRSEAPLALEDLSNSLENLLNELGIPWSKPRLTKRKAYQRTAIWNN